MRRTFTARDANGRPIDGCTAGGFSDVPPLIARCSGKAAVYGKAAIAHARKGRDDKAYELARAAISNALKFLRHVEMEL